MQYRNGFFSTRFKELWPRICRSKIFRVAESLLALFWHTARSLVSAHDEAKRLVLPSCAFRLVQGVPPGTLLANPPNQHFCFQYGRPAN